VKTVAFAIALAAAGVLLIAAVVRAIALYMPSPYSDEDIHL
jgi:hypothetical protein